MSYESLLIAMGIVGVLGIACYAYMLLNRGWTVRQLFRDFKSKAYMTCYLGFAFLCVYLLLVAICLLLAQMWGSEILSLFTLYKIEMVYAGLSLFVAISFGIIIVRMVIKYFYLKR